MAFDTRSKISETDIEMFDQFANPKTLGGDSEMHNIFDNLRTMIGAPAPQSAKIEEVPY